MYEVYHYPSSEEADLSIMVDPILPQILTLPKLTLSFTFVQNNTFHSTWAI